MPITYDSLATTTLGTTNSTISFQSISTGYSDLRVIWRGIYSGNTVDNVIVRINNISSTSYFQRNLWGNTSITTADSTSNSSAFQPLIGQSLGFTRPEGFILDFINYKCEQSANPGVLMQYMGDKATSGYVGFAAGVNNSISSTAINRIDIIASGGTFAIGTTATLYGILRA